MDTNKLPLAIDPHNCGCTECLTGEYVPSAQATPAQILAMLTGEIANNTGPVEISFAVEDGQWTFRSAFVDIRSWSPEDFDDDDVERVRRLTPHDIVA